MVKIIIVDASVAIKWFVVEEDKREEAISILDAIQNAPQNFVVPEIFFNEMLSVLCKLLDDKKMVKTYMLALESLGLTRIGNGSELLAQAASIAVDHKLTGYDAVYAATAKLMGGHWLTADHRAHKRIESLKVSKLL